MVARQRSGRPLADATRFAAAWLAAELARGVIFTGFPWLATGYSQLDGPLAVLVPWLGVYALGALSAWRVARAPASKERSLALGLWATQLAFNAAWTPVFFGAHRPGLALATLAGNHASLSAYALAARKVDATAAWMVTPYLGWISFAGVLNGTIVLRNR